MNTTQSSLATLSDADLSAAIAATAAESAPFYAALEAMGKDIFLPRSCRYVPAAQALDDRITPLAKLSTALAIERKRRVDEVASAKYHAARELRISAAAVWQRRNGWEIVRDGIEYVLRDPADKTEVYSNWKLTRVREVASESAPMGATQSSGI